MVYKPGVSTLREAMGEGTMPTAHLQAYSDKTRSVGAKGDRGGSVLAQLKGR